MANIRASHEDGLAVNGSAVLGYATDRVAKRPGITVHGA